MWTNANCPTPPWNFTPTYTYDAENHLVSAGGATYTYDGDGNRVVKMSGSTGTLYWRGADGETVSETDATNTIERRHVFFAGRRIFRADNKPTWTAHFYFSDHLGSSNVIINPTNGSIEDESDFYPYGGELPITDTVPQNYKFTGKERDAESGLDNFGARYFASTIGRFMTPDWAGRPTAVPYAVFGDPQSLNLYGYVRNDPVSRADADGHLGGCTTDSGGTAHCPRDDASSTEKGPAPGAQNTPSTPPPNVQKALDLNQPPDAKEFLVFYSCPDCKYYPKDVQDAVKAHEDQHKSDVLHLNFSGGIAGMELRAFAAELKVENAKIDGLNSKSSLTPEESKSLAILTNMRDSAQGVLSESKYYATRSQELDRGSIPSPASYACAKAGTGCD